MTMGFIFQMAQKQLRNSPSSSLSCNLFKFTHELSSPMLVAIMLHSASIVSISSANMTTKPLRSPSSATSLSSAL